MISKNVLLLESVRWKNFMSYGAVYSELRFDTPGTYLVTGINLDQTVDGEESSNGTGKTTAIVAIAFALYGKHLKTTIPLDDLVNNINKKNMEVTCNFKVDDRSYTVIRTRKAKAGAAGNTVRLICDNVDITPDSVSACNALIEKIIGIPFEVFTRIVIFSASHTPFLQLPVRHPTQVNQTSIIEHLCGLTVMSEKAEELKKVIADTSRELDTLKTIASTKESERQRYNTTLKNVTQRRDGWEADRNKSVDELRASLETLESIDVDIVRNNIDRLEQLNKQLVQQEGLLSGAQTNKRRLEKRLAEAVKQYSHLTDERCPYCLQEFKDASEKINALEEEMLDIEEQLNACNDGITSFGADVEELKANIKSVSDSLTVVKSHRELDKLVSVGSVAQAKIDDLLNSTNPFVDVVRELEEQTLEEAEYEDINNLQQLIDHQKFLLKLLTKNDSFIRKRLLNRNIPYLNERLQLHLSALGMTHKAEFTHDMEINITQFGRKLGHDNLSVGQAARVNLALAWAFRDVYQRRYRKINVSMLDEALDVGLDSSGIKAAVRLIKRQARDEGIALFIVTHKGDMIGPAFDHTVNVRFEKGFSRIVPNDELIEDAS